MADTRISDENALVTPAPADLLLCVQGGANFKTTRAQLHALQSGEHLTFPVVDEPTTPTLAWGSAGLGFYAATSGFLRLAVGGSKVFRWGADGFLVREDIDGPMLAAEAPSRTNPTLIPFASDPDTGVGRGVADELCMIAGGVEGLRMSEASGHVVWGLEADTGIVASTTQDQGEQALLSSVNQIATVANANDVVTAPAPYKGALLIIKNGAGLNPLQVFPAAGDDIGAGANNSITLLAGAAGWWIGLDTDNWFRIV